MKKWVALLLVLTMAFCMMAGCANKDNKDDANKVEDDVVLPASALELLESAWALYNHEFPAMGGDFSAPVDGAPGAVAMGGEENPLWNLYVPEDQLANVTEAATVIHAMNANTFTCGGLKLADGVDAAAFATTMRDIIMSNHWMCGFPERLIIANIGSYVVIAFGLDGVNFPEEGKLITPFADALKQAYAGVEILVNEEIK